MQAVNLKMAEINTQKVFFQVILVSFNSFMENILGLLDARWLLKGYLLC